MSKNETQPTRTCPRCGVSDWYRTSENRLRKGFGFTLYDKTVYVWSCKKCGEKLLDEGFTNIRKPNKFFRFLGLYIMIVGSVVSLATLVVNEGSILAPIALWLIWMPLGFLIYKRGKKDNRNT